MDSLLEIVQYILLTSGACAWIAAKAHGEYENKYVQFFVNLLNFIGGNVYNAKNIK